MDPITQLCYANHEIYAKYGVSDTKFYGGAEKPSAWKDHPGCSNCDGMLQYICTKHALHPDNKKNPRSAEGGTQFAFTLTMPPDYQPAKPLPEVAKKILEYGLTNKPFEKASKWAYVLEHTDKGTPHIHGVYETPSGRRLSSKYFKRYWPLWTENPKDPGYKKLGNGFIGGYHQKARHNESYNAYLEKEGTVTKFSQPIVSNGPAQTSDEESSPPPSPQSPQADYVGQ